jgi:hypothetical protein
MNDESFRAAVLRAHGARGGEVDELLAYTRSAFVIPDRGAALDDPVPDEPFVDAWEQYAAESEEVGAAESLRRRLVQLRFPIAAGMSASAVYRAATRRGELDSLPHDGGLTFERPDDLRIFVHPTAAGRVPVVVTGARADFVALVQALVHRNEPADVPRSMGACIVAGYNNWDRIAALRARWMREHEAERSCRRWTEELRRLVPMRELYQDSFILLSSGPYSAVPAYAMGLDEHEWLGLSHTIRLEHECAHYVTRRVLGSMRNSLLDELIADYIGIAAAAGRFRADWFLRFMGLERFAHYRLGGRLENYRGEPPLSERAFTVLAAVVRAAAAQLERFDSRRPRSAGSAEWRGRMIVAVAELGLERLASSTGADLLGSLARGPNRKGGAQMTPA